MPPLPEDVREGSAASSSQALAGLRQFLERRIYWGVFNPSMRGFVGKPLTPRWSFQKARGHFRITLTSDCADVRVVSTRRGLAVPQRTPDGKPVSAEALQEILRLVRQKAEKRWNDLDRSDRPRF